MSMISVKRVDESRFNQVYPLLQELDVSNLTKADLRTIFNNVWKKDEAYCGYGLFENGKIIGFIGLIFCKRVIDGKIESFCNITSWIVEEKYRAHSLSLILPLLKLKNHTLTDLSPTDVVVSVLKRVGFKELDSKLKVLIPWGIFRKNHPPSFQITSNEDLIKKTLNDQVLTLFQDHRPYHCNHILAREHADYCYIIYTKVKNPRFPYCYIQYISNSELFFRYSSRIISAIAKRGQTRIVIVDSRFVRKIKFPGCFKFSLRYPKLYKSPTLEPEKIDNLYSEFILLNFNILPTKLRHLRQKWSG